MTLAINQTLSAVGPNITASFGPIGGTGPYVFSVRAGGAGGTIDGSTGLYTAPPTVSQNPKQLYDVIQCKDSLGAKATAQILVGTPLLLFCEIIQRQMGLDIGRVYLWDQKIMQPTDAGLYIAVSVLRCKPFANTNSFDGTTNQSIQSVNMHADLQLDIISRDGEARDRKEEVIMALVSDYAQLQMTANSFSVFPLPPGAQFVNLSNEDGAAIPYRFSIAVAMQYFATKIQDVPYFSNFQTPQINTNP